MECSKPNRVHFEQREPPNPNRKPKLYPDVVQSNPDAQPNPKPEPSAPSLYPTLDMNDLVGDLFPEDPRYYEIPPEDQFHDSLEPPSAPPLAAEEVVIRIPGAIVNLIDKEYSVELASGDFTIVKLVQGDDVVAVLARVEDEIQWPLLKDEAVVKLDDSHYFFSLYAPENPESSSAPPPETVENEKEKKKKKEKKEKKEKKAAKDVDNFLNYGLTIPAKGQEKLVKELEEVLKSCSSFSVQKVSEKAKKGEALDSSLALDTAPGELSSERKKEMKEQSAAYWTTLAPNVEDYNGRAAKLIAAGTGQLIKGILWCGDVTVERLKWGNEVMKKRMEPGSHKEVSPQTMRRIKRAKRVSKTTQKVATCVLSGVLKVSGYFTSTVINSKVGKKFFRLLPGEILLAGLDGFCKVCDAVEVAGKNVMSTSSTVTTELVSHKYGEEAGKAASEGLDAAGHAIGTAWTVFKIRKALNPKSAFKSSTLAKSAAKAKADEVRAAKKK
ncbi:protein EARLY-RESPONSIVE TO DEHYDRATION 7, chloroplastic-like [Argentina anserina]|uniref:protein EARLY-RESPONSIVE TO DEHYDRATION 7, chloroplastic-like n=1 Tax=Argentina anserina TaxID=57926 RepID=UPI0021763595|nr:protein EARLY-RESPONSIVE TO DEHYDRATION 7, chloroplastic-like [Potentilla anserina]